MRQQRATGRGDQGTGRDQPADHLRLASQAAEVQVQTALEEDHRDGVADEDLERRAERLGIDHAGDIGAEQGAGGE